MHGFKFNSMECINWPNLNRYEKFIETPAIINGMLAAMSFYMKNFKMKL